MADRKADILYINEWTKALKQYVWNNFEAFTSMELCMDIDKLSFALTTTTVQTNEAVLALGSIFRWSRDFAKDIVRQMKTLPNEIMNTLATYLLRNELINWFYQ